jgi:heme-degrading monooxygenase HmoA
MYARPPQGAGLRRRSATGEAVDSPSDWIVWPRYKRGYDGSNKHARRGHACQDEPVGTYANAGLIYKATADDYQHHHETEVAEHLQQIPGFCGARLLRRQDGDEVMFTSITFFTSMDDVRAFAGQNPEQAVVEDTARRALTRWDERVTHQEVTVELRSSPTDPIQRH